MRTIVSPTPVQKTGLTPRMRAEIQSDRPGGTRLWTGNVLAYRFLSANPLNELLDVEIVAGLDRGLGLCLGVRPGLTDPADLRGGRLGVDVPNSGFAFVAYALLEDMGLSRHELEVVALGSTPKRARALHAGVCDITVLNAGNELSARAQGCTLLADVTRLGPYLGTVVARMRQASKAEEIDRLVLALGETAQAILGGELDREASETAARLLGLAPNLAAEHVAVLRDPERGLIDDGSVDATALATLVGLRQRFLPTPELDGLSDRFHELHR